MAEYIEREKAIDDLLSWAVCINHPEHLHREDALCALRSIPAEDVKKVVRCKDCRHNVVNQTRDPYDVTDYTDIVCTWFMTDGVGAEDYCSHGERSADA